MAYSSSEDQKRAAHGHYLRNKAVYKARATRFKRVAKLRNKQYLKDYLSAHPCVDCGESDIVVLEFDHVIGIKRREVTLLAHQAVSLSTLMHEIAKCEVRCANCHRRVTYRRRLEKKPSHLAHNQEIRGALPRPATN